MDTITHALVGSAIADGWFRKRLGPIATPFALISAALPDVDAITYLFSPETAWALHRSYTHSFIPILLAAPIIGYVGFRLSKQYGEWRLWTLLAVLCLFSHTILDMTTSWGTMPLLPFSNARVSWDIAPILDVFMFTSTMTSFVLNRMLRRERTQTFLNPITYPVTHKYPKRRRIADWVGRGAVALAVIYLAVGWGQNRQTVRVAKKALAQQGIEAENVRALPAMFTYIAWQIAAKDKNGNVYNSVHSSYAPKTMRFVQYPEVNGREVATAKETARGKMFKWYTQGLAVAENSENRIVWLTDRRFWSLVKPHESRFAMGFSGDGNGGWKVKKAAYIPLTLEKLKDEFRALWRLTWKGEWDGGE